MATLKQLYGLFRRLSGESTLIGYASSICQNWGFRIRPSPRRGEIHHVPGCVGSNPFLAISSNPPCQLRD